MSIPTIINFKYVLIMVMLCLLLKYTNCYQAVIPDTKLYTMNGTIPMETFLVDDSNNGLGYHYTFSEASFNKLALSLNETIIKISENIEYLKQNYKDLDPRILTNKLTKKQWVILAMVLNRNIFNSAKVVVFGSQEPWVEAVAILLGAKEITVIDYNQLTYHHNKIKTISKHNFLDFFSYHSNELGTYDIALSISAFDHSGLGRYGDQLDPFGDINEGMSKVKDLLKVDGLLFLTVPIGPDLLVWNMMRIYGPIRLELLLDGWEYVDRVGWDQNKLTQETDNYRDTFEPVLILKLKHLMKEEL